MTATVSVVVAAYREERRIGAMLDSVAAQTRAPLEVIVVDDGSPDRTAATAERHGARVLRMAHAGAGAARRAGASAARGDILVFLDADDEFDPDFLEALVAPIEAGAARATFPGVIAWSNLGEGLADGWLRVRLGRSLRSPALGTSNVWPYALRREDLERIGGYPVAGYGEDLVLGERLGVPATVVPGAVMRTSLPCTAREILRTARWIARGPRFANESPPLRWHTPPWSLWRAARLAREGDPRAALVRLLYDLGILAGALDRRLRPGVVDRA